MDPIPLRVLLALTLWCGGVLGCAAVTGAGKSGKAGPLGGLLALLAALCLPPSWALGRLFAAAFGLLALGRAFDLSRRPEALSFWARVWMLLGLFDIREAASIRPRFDTREAIWCSVHLLTLAGSWVLIDTLGPEPTSAGVWILRWGCGLVLIYALAETIQSSMLVVYRGLGIDFSRINDYPIVSRTLSEFWGRRWNRVVSGWLSEYFFMPLARRRMIRLGVVAAFVASAGTHFWLAWVPLDLCAGLTMASFFLIQGLGALLERGIGVRRWKPTLQRVWTIAWVVLPSPLFIEPALALLDPFRRSLAQF